MNRWLKVSGEGHLNGTDWVEWVELDGNETEIDLKDIALEVVGEYFTYGYTVVDEYGSDKEV